MPLVGAADVPRWRPAVISGAEKEKGVLAHPLVLEMEVALEKPYLAPQPGFIAGGGLGDVHRVFTIFYYFHRKLQWRLPEPSAATGVRSTCSGIVSKMNGEGRPKNFTKCFLLFTRSRFKERSSFYSLKFAWRWPLFKPQENQPFSKVYRKDRPRHAQAGAALCFLCEAPWLVAYCGSMGCAPL